MKVSTRETRRPRALRTVTAIPLATVMVAGGAAGFATAADSRAAGAALNPAVDCAALGVLTLADVLVTAATEVTATAGAPGYCRILGTEPISGPTSESDNDCQEMLSLSFITLWRSDAPPPSSVYEPTNRCSRLEGCSNSGMAGRQRSQGVLDLRREQETICY